MQLVVIILWLLAVYLLIGAAFAVPFVFRGAAKIDSHANHGSWGFRLLILPGTVFLWPLLARRWMEAKGSPPEERTAHRLSAAQAQKL